MSEELEALKEEMRARFDVLDAGMQRLLREPARHGARRAWMSVPAYARDRIPYAPAWIRTGDRTLSAEQRRLASQIRRRLLFDKEPVPGSIRAQRRKINGKPSRGIVIHSGDADREMGFEKRG